MVMDETKTEIIIQKFREWRLQKSGMTINQIGKALEYDPGTICRVVNGKELPSKTLFYRMRKIVIRAKM